MNLPSVILISKSEVPRDADSCPLIWERVANSDDVTSSHDFSRGLSPAFSVGSINCGRVDRFILVSLQQTHMTDFELSLPGSRPRARAASASEWILAEMYERTDAPMYVSKLGALTVAFEAYYISEFGEPYIDITLNSIDKPCEPDIVQEGLVDVIDAHPTRTAYWHGRRTKKVYGWRAVDEDDPDPDVQRMITQLLDEGGETLSPTDLKEQIREWRPLPWE